MRDYAKKSFSSSKPALQAAGPTQGSVQKSEAKKGLEKSWGYWGVTLGIVIVGILTAQAFYKHFHNEAINAQTSGGAPIKTLNATGNPNTPPNALPNTPPKPVFDFYNMLPKQTIATPPAPAPITAIAQQPNPVTTTITPAPAAPIAAANPISNTSTPTAPASSYLIQVGAYRNKDQARSMQARLLLLGLHPSISPADSGWYRVNLGPYNSVSTASNIRHKLQNAHINNAEIKPNPSAQSAQK